MSASPDSSEEAQICFSWEVYWYPHSYSQYSQVELMSQGLLWEVQQGQMPVPSFGSQLQTALQAWGRVSGKCLWEHRKGPGHADGQWCTCSVWSLAPQVLCPSRMTLRCWSTSREHQQNWGRVWSMSLMRSCWGSWGSLAWRKGCSGGTLLLYRRWRWISSTA